jgi:methanethiol S-methyltransferase
MDLILVALAWGLYGLLHSALAASRVKDRVAHHWPALVPAYRLLFNLLATLLLLPPLWLTWRVPGEALWHWPAWIAWLAALATLAGYLWSLRWYDGLDFIGLTQWRTRGRATATTDSLVFSPLHRHVRHPWYSLGLLMLWTRDLNAAWLVAAVTVTLYLVVGSRLEERKLVAQFGETYRRYQQQVPALVPRLWRRRGADAPQSTDSSL